MKKETHLKAFQEHRETIDWAIDRGIEKSQRIIGMHASRGVVELLSAYLHKINKIEIGFQINHRWFKSSNIYEKFPDFPKKRIIFSRMIELEDFTEKLTYGSDRSIKEIKKTLELFNELERILTELMENE